MQRLNLLTLAAFLLGLGAFVYDSMTPRAARFAGSQPIEAVAYLDGIPTALE